MGAHRTGVLICGRRFAFAQRDSNHSATGRRFVCGDKGRKQGLRQRNDPESPLGSQVAVESPSGHLGRIPGEGLRAPSWLAMGKFSPTKQHGDCEEIANPSTAYGRRRRNWIDVHGSVPAGQVVDASCGNQRCITLKHAYLRSRVEQPRKYPKIAERVHRLRIGQHFDVPGVGTDERSRNRFRSGLYAAARLDRVSVRGQPDGSVRVTKVGEWSSVRE
jgi:hypothetical protein